MRIQFSWDKSIGPMLHLITTKKEYIFCFCHHDPERSIPFFGLEKYLCSRCMGILFGAIFAYILLFFNFHLSIYVAIGMIIPLLIDGFTQAFEMRKSNNRIRLITGILFGFGMVFVLA